MHSVYIHSVFSFMMISGNAFHDGDPDHSPVLPGTVDIYMYPSHTAHAHLKVSSGQLNYLDFVLTALLAPFVLS